MSFQLENSHPQPKNSLLSTTDLLGGFSSDGVLVSNVVVPVTLDLFQIKQSPPRIIFHPPCPIRDTFLDDYKSKQKRSLEDHKSEEETMSRRNDNNVPKLDLKLNLSPPSSRMRANPNLNPRTESPNRSASVSPPSSCVSSDVSMSSPEATSMVLAGCPRCLMYVMLSEDDPKCPKCKSTVLLDFAHDKTTNNNNNNSGSGSSKKTRKG